MGVPGVSNVSIWGQRERQLQVQVDPEVLEEKEVSLIQVIKTAGNSLWYSPLTFLEASIAGTGGFIETPNQRLGIRHVLPIQTADDLALVPLEDSNLRLDDVATVVEDHQPLIGDALNANGPSLLLVIEKLPGVNTLEVTDEILEALEALSPGLGGIQFDPTVYQPAQYIRTTIRNIGGALLIALILVAVGLLALTYDWRAALIGVVAIPLSLMVAVLVINAFGATINMMVLAGLVVALGVVIDDAIVDADSFLRRLRRGSGKSTARTVLDAAADLRSPLLFATAIVLMTALPFLFMSGIPGAFVKPAAMSYGIAVLASLLVAVTLTPALALMFFRKTQLERRESPLSRWMSRRTSYAPRPAVAFAILAAVTGAALVPMLDVTTAPTFKEPDLMVQWESAPGTSRGEMNRILERVSAELRGVPGVRNVGAHVGRALLADQVVGINSSELWISLDPQADYEATVAAVEEIAAGYPGIDADVLTFLRSRFGEQLAGVDEPIVVGVYGQEQSVLLQQAEKVNQTIAAVNGVTDARIEMEAEEPVVEIKVDLDAAQKHGVKPGDVRRAAATLVAGIEVGNLFEEQKVFQVVVWGVPDVRHSLQAIHDLLIDTPSGDYVRLGDVATVRMTSSPEIIRRENVARRIDVVANVTGRDVNTVSAEVQDRIRSLQFPLEYRAELLGDFAAQEAGRKRVLWVGIAAAAAILVLLQGAFGTWPLAVGVLLTLPIALGGGVISAVAGGAALSLGSILGFLTVLGVAARQAMLLVSRCHELRHREGNEFGPALVLAAMRERGAAILTTAIVTGLAVAPFALLASRPGHEILGPMALVILGGLVTSTLYAFGIVPLLYARLGAGAMPDIVNEAELNETQMAG
jgi:Cu/Ag efflux pump CusA